MAVVSPAVEAIQELLANHQGPLVMLNLLKFKERSDDGKSTGAAAYGRYSQAVTKLLDKRGARIMWIGHPTAVLAGNDDNWDAVALVEYPDKQAFMDMVSSPEYQAVHIHREAGLERTVLIACTPRPFIS